MMERRAVLKRIGAAGAATAVLAAPATARPGWTVHLDRTVDVSGVSGRVVLDDLIEEDVETVFDDTDVADHPEVAGPADLVLVVSEDVDEIDFSAQTCCPACNGSCQCDCCDTDICSQQ